MSASPAPLQRYQFTQKTERMKRGLTELIDQPMGGSEGGKKTQESLHLSSEEATEKLEFLVTKLRRGKREDRTRIQKLSKELDELQQENERLKEMCASLQAKMHPDQVTYLCMCVCVLCTRTCAVAVGVSRG